MPTLTSEISQIKMIAKFVSAAEMPGSRPDWIMNLVCFSSRSYFPRRSNIPPLHPTYKVFFTQTDLMQLALLSDYSVFPLRDGGGGK